MPTSPSTRHFAPTLAKCSPVSFLRQVWYIPQTGEVFVTYEDYLNRYAVLT